MWYAYDSPTHSTIYLVASLVCCKNNQIIFLQEQPLSMEVWNKKANFLNTYFNLQPSPL
jgi:hypothetical protein